MPQPLHIQESLKTTQEKWKDMYGSRVVCWLTRFDNLSATRSWKTRLARETKSQEVLLLQTCVFAGGTGQAKLKSLALARHPHEPAAQH